MTRLLWLLIKFERVAHIHLANVNNPFPPQLPRYFSRTNDEAHLVYCQGAFDEQAWLLIAILSLNLINWLEITTKCIKLENGRSVSHAFLNYIMNNIQIRNYQPGDFQQLCAIFIRAVTMTASQHYSPQQIAAWAQIDESRWKE